MTKTFKSEHRKSLHPAPPENLPLVSAPPPPPGPRSEFERLIAKISEAQGQMADLQKDEERGGGVFILLY
jgi:hypothetical protein